MIHLLSDYTIDARTRYEGHTLFYTPENADPIELRGILAAAILAALIVDTDEGDARGIALDTDAERAEFFTRYEREVRRDNGGLFSTEVQALNEAFLEFTGEEETLSHICRNDRLFDLAIGLMVEYMQRLVIEIFKEHIWEAVPWKAPFPQWLIDAARVETRRQRFLHTDWTDAPIVCALADEQSSISNLQSPIEEAPTFFFEGEKAADIMERYLQWLSDEYIAMKQELPGSKITSADRKFIFSQETDWAFLSDEIDQLDASEQKEWRSWQTEWRHFLTDRLLPQKDIRFWANDMPEEVQEHLLYHLQLAEQHPAHFRDLTTAVYAMRQLGYIRRKCSDHDLRQWLSEHLKLNYMERKNASQFQRAMKEHGRYTPEVRDEVLLLESMGYFRVQPSSSPDRSR